MDASEEVSEIMQECRLILRVGEVIQACRSILSAEAMAGVDHYYTHNEREMAFESLVINLMQADVVPPSYDYGTWCALAKDLCL